MTNQLPEGPKPLSGDKPAVGIEWNREFFLNSPESLTDDELARMEAEWPD